MSERRKLTQSLFKQIALLGHGANVSAGSFASQDPGTLLPIARPLETGHLLLQFPDSGTAVLLLSQKVTLLIIYKELENANMARVCFLRILVRFWFQTLESKILDPTGCISLVTSFDTSQQRPTMLDDVGSV